MPDSAYISNDAKHKTEHWTSRVLLISVWISASFMIAGSLIGEIFPSTIVVFYENPTLGNLAMRILSGSFDPVTLMFAGLVFLMLTPIFRVITAVTGFSAERDWRFVIVAIVVLVLLVGEIVYSVLIRN